MEGSVMPVNPWFHRDYEPADPAVWTLASSVIAATGGSHTPLDSRTSESRGVHLEKWFRAMIPDLLGSALDYAAIESHAQYLTVCEGSGEAVASWGRAVIAHFRRHPQWPGCYEETKSRLAVGVPSAAIAVRGMQLYAAAFTRLAESLNINTIRVYRGMTEAPARWQPNALASAAWSAKHSTSGDRVVKFADVHPSVVVAVTAVYECHPVIAPFSVTAGPGHHPVSFQNL